MFHLPFDGSGAATRSLKHAIRLCRSHRTKLHLLSVQPDLDDYAMVRAYLTRSKHRKVMAARAHPLLKSAERVLRKAHVQHSSHIAFGDPANAIVRSARRMKCGSIVMGTRGLGSVGSMLLGSVASKTIHLAPVPVTLVR